MIDPQQQTLFDDSDVAKDEGADFGDTSFKGNKKEPLHRWTPWIAGFSSDFVGGIIRRELAEAGTVLDPFCGVGTTLIEANERGHDSVGFDINPYAVFAARTKMGARTVNAEALENAIEDFTGFYLSRVKDGYEPKSQVPGGFNTRSEFYAPKVERKVLSRPIEVP
jgi:SAM-dependent methyltransferase